MGEKEKAKVLKYIYYARGVAKDPDGINIFQDTVGEGSSYAEAYNDAVSQFFPGYRFLMGELDTKEVEPPKES